MQLTRSKRDTVHGSLHGIHLQEKWKTSKEAEKGERGCLIQLVQQLDFTELTCRAQEMCWHVRKGNRMLCTRAFFWVGDFSSLAILNQMILLSARTPSPQLKWMPCVHPESGVCIASKG